MCRCDLTMPFDVATADDFTRRYERTRGAPVPDLLFWNLYSTTHALRYMDEWAAGYVALGRADLTPSLARQRVGDYARQLLTTVER
jgi:hypothetical protein